MTMSMRFKIGVLLLRPEFEEDYRRAAERANAAAKVLPATPTSHDQERYWMGCLEGVRRFLIPESRA